MEAVSDRAAEYAPKRVWYATIVLWLVSAMLVWAAFMVSRAEIPPLAVTALQAFYGSLILICLGALYGLRYALSDEHFSASVGPIRIRVRLADIETVRPGWLKSGRSWKWGLTMKGLVIERRGKRIGVGISPDDAETFLRDLAARCPHLEPYDGGLSSRTDPADPA